MASSNSQPSDLQLETVTAPTNIACIKYWGKADVKFNTPINSSVSVTLDQDDLRAITSVAASRSYSNKSGSSDRLWLNGSELSLDDIEKNPHAQRFKTCMKEMRKLARDRVDPTTGAVVVRKEEWAEFGVHVVSRNTFPTAAGLASSAAGYACLVFALAKLFAIPTDEAGLSELSVIARQGSGSACRSLFGGFVKWQMGSAESGWKDSRAVPVAAQADWPDLETLILVVNDAKKDTSSTDGMGASVATSPLLGFRAREVVEPRLQRIEEAFKAKDFAAFGDLTMADSNQFHATCLDTLPPIFYLNDTSRQVIRLVHAFNAYHKATIAAYTFDAGPNAVIFVAKKWHARLTAFMLHFFPPPSLDHLAAFTNRPDLLTAGLDALRSSSSSSSGKEKEEEDGGAVPKALLEAGAATGRVPHTGDIKMMYCTRIGEGPRHLTSSDPAACLIDPLTGGPKRLDSPSSGVRASPRPPSSSSSSQPSASLATLEAKIDDVAAALESLASFSSSSSPRFTTCDVIKFTAVLSAFYVALGVGMSRLRRT